MKLGTKETTDVIVLAAVLADDLQKANADGKISIMDLPKFFNLLGPARAAMTGIKDVAAELADLDEAEFAGLADNIAELIDPTLSGDYAKELAEAARHTAEGLVSMLAIIRRHKAGEEIPKAQPVAPDA